MAVILIRVFPLVVSYPYVKPGDSVYFGGEAGVCDRFHHWLTILSQITKQDESRKKKIPGIELSLSHFRSSCMHMYTGKPLNEVTRRWAPQDAAAIKQSRDIP